MLRAAIYARVSSQAQRESQTIESQLRVLPAFVAAQGWHLVGTYIDDGKSARAGKLDKRDGFARLARDAQAGMFDVLVVIDIDRLTRTDDMRERAAILGPFQAAGIRIVTPSGGELDLRTMLGELYVTLQAMFAAEENRKRGERTKRGQQRSAEDGGKPNGRTPYGLAYDREARTWSLDPVRSDAVREIYSRVVSGESCAQISADLQERGVPPPTKHWHPAAVYRIVCSRYPVGEWVARKSSRVVVNVPPMVDESTWQRARDALTVVKLRGLRKTRHVYLLEGIATCGECGAPILIKSADVNNNKARYFCRARRRPTPGHHCAERTITVHEADARVWETVVRELDDPGLADALAERAAHRSENRKAWEKDAARYRGDLQRLTKAEQAFMARYRKGLISDDALDAGLLDLRKERAFAEEQLQAAERAASADETDERPSAWLDAIRLLVRDGSPEARRRVVRAVVKRAEISDGRVLLTMRIGEQSGGGLVRRSSTSTGCEATITIRAVA